MLVNIPPKCYFSNQLTSHVWDISPFSVYIMWYILCGIYYVVYIMWYILCVLLLLFNASSLYKYKNVYKNTHLLLFIKIHGVGWSKMIKSRS